MSLSLPLASVDTSPLEAPLADSLHSYVYERLYSLYPYDLIAAQRMMEVWNDWNYYHAENGRISLVDDFVNAILDRSEGWQKYAELFMDDIESGALSITKPLWYFRNHVPHGLEEYYEGEAGRLFGSIDSEIRRGCEGAIAALCAAKEPLPLELVRKIVTRAVGEGKFERVKEALSPFFSVREGRFHAIHTSVLGWLRVWGGSGVKEEEGHGMLGREFLKLVEGGRFEINGMKVEEWEAWERYLLKHGMLHLMLHLTEECMGGGDGREVEAAVDIALSFPWLLAKAEIHSSEPQKIRDDVARVERMLIRMEEGGRRSGDGGGKRRAFELRGGGRRRALELLISALNLGMQEMRKDWRNLGVELVKSLMGYGEKEADDVKEFYNEDIKLLLDEVKTWDGGGGEGGGWWCPVSRIYQPAGEACMSLFTFFLVNCSAV